MSKLVCIACLGLTFLSSCGGGTFHDDSTNQKKPEARPKSQDPKPTSAEANPLEAPLANTLTWSWACTSATDSATSASTDPLRVSGDGEHSVKIESDAQDLNVNLSGKLCQPNEQPRDLVFVIDVSGSMKTNDPRKSDSCGRLDALKKILLETTPQNSQTKFALVTFSTQVERRSSAMFSSQASLFSDISNGATIADVICADELDTSYGAALTDAAAILKSGRPGATKEIYFISDGEPSDGTDGVDIARNLKRDGIRIQGETTKIQIAAVMLGKADGSILQNQISSTDASGRPLFQTAENSDQLASALASFANNDITKATLRYRTSENEAWVSVSLKEKMKGYEFQVPSFKIPVEASQGLEVQIDYNDAHQNTFSRGGKIIWKKDDHPTGPRES